MPAGGEEQAVGKRRGVGQARGERVRFQMIDRDQRLAADQSDRLGRGQSDDHAADQSGSGGRRDPVDRVKALAGVGHRLGDDAIERLDMRARGDLRHHAAEGGMLVDLREHDIGQDLARPLVGPFDHGGRGLVACRLDSEYKHGASRLK